MIQFADEKEEKELADIRQQEEEDVTRLMAEKQGLPYIDLIPLPIENDALKLLSEGAARTAKAAPFSITGKKVAVAVSSPEIPETQAVIEKLSQAGYGLTLYLASRRSLEKAWSHYKELRAGTPTRAGAVELESGAIAEAVSLIKTLPELKAHVQEILASKQQNRISQLVEMILGGAIAIDASDIHIEPEKNTVRLRLRLDGILQEALTFDPATYRLVNSRIKLLSGLKLNVQKEAQDGRFSVNLKDMDVEIRTSVLPGAYGESIVLRLLNPKTIAVPLEELGMQPRVLEAVGKEIRKPNGMLLTTGPTGSGKTTTLYAFLRKIHTPGVKIITIEDPIEYHLPGIVQTQVEKEKRYTFASGLRSALRQDPDVIMVGEIRDEETAEIAINASLTGHLVFSTLHTNNAPGTYPRLIDLGVNPKVITSAITLAMAQRLVRKLCTHCRAEVQIPAAEKMKIEKIIAPLPEAKAAQRERMWVPKGLPPDLVRPTATDGHAQVGCEACNHTGFKGRTGIYEAILSDAAIERIVKENPSEREIAAAAAPQGIPTMVQDGVLKVLAGITSWEELQRVVDLEM